MCNIYACNLHGQASIYTHGDGGHIATPKEELHMYTLQYRYKRVSNRWTQWFKESQHDDQWEAIKALGEHVSAFETFSVRVVLNETDKVIAEYKFKK